jgi:hypothetical protein
MMTIGLMEFALKAMTLNARLTTR